MKKILFSILVVIVGGLMLVAPVFAEKKCTQTSIIGNSVCDSFLYNYKRDNDPNKQLGPNEVLCLCDSGHGESVEYIVNLVVDILTIGVGIIGVVGISIVGIQYLTAGGNEEKTRKAKRRMFEIVIGLVVYVIMSFVLKWLGVVIK